MSFVSPYLRLRYRHVPILAFVALMFGAMNYFLYFHPEWFDPLADRISCEWFEPCIGFTLPEKPAVLPESPSILLPEIIVLYVQGNNAILHNVAKPPKDGTSRLRQFHKCHSFIKFGRVEEWIEVGEVRPQGWMHESLLYPEKPEGCE